ncbi:MAG: right-handed parallel beta-helix repeat-containing protein [Acidimicrobiales bacterium]|nr:right-handed parallel beta-helix repeat-containing protein [Acidimicrobiales bacterium]
MRTRLAVIAASAAIVMSGLSLLPASVAGAKSALWVSNSVAVGNNSSCSSPGYNTVSAALTAATSGALIEVCGGGGPYVEQLTITKPVTLTSVGNVTLQLPSVPADNNDTCDNAVTAAGYQAPQDEVSICVSSGTVTLNSITVSAYWPAGTCYDSEYGVFVGKGNLVANGLTVSGAGVPIGDSAVGCQGGVAVQVGSARPSPNLAATATLKGVAVSGYQKNGLTTTGFGSTMTVTGATVVGRGPVGTAENGIEVAFGAKGVIRSATVSGDQCQLPGVCGPDAQNDTQASGVLFYGAAPGSSLSKSTISGNDMGVYYGSTAATEPGTPEVTISGNHFSGGGAYEQVELDQGVATISHNVIDGSGNAGIQVLQYGSQSYAPAEVAKSDTISGQGIGVQVYSDQAASDPAGVFNISKSHFLTTNTVPESDNSNNYVIQGSQNH